MPAKRLSFTVPAPPLPQTPFIHHPYPTPTLTAFDSPSPVGTPYPNPTPNAFHSFGPPFLSLSPTAPTLSSVPFNPRSYPTRNAFHSPPLPHLFPPFIHRRCPTPCPLTPHHTPSDHHHLSQPTNGFSFISMNFLISPYLCTCIQ